MRQTLKRNEILRGRSNFRLVFKRGRRVEGKLIGCLVVTDPSLVVPDGAHVVVGFSVSQRVRRAVDRNRVRRMVRESYRTNKSILIPRTSSLPQPLAILFRYSKQTNRLADLPSYLNIEEDVKRLLHEIVEIRLGPWAR